MPKRIETLRRRFALGTRFALRALAAKVAGPLRRRAQYLSLEAVQRRLELQLIAMYGRPISIAPAQRRRRALDRLRRLIELDVGSAEAVPAIDGDAIKLPPVLAAPNGEMQALGRYRLFAIEQAERLARGTVAFAPVNDRLERDLFLLREAAAIDAAIARAHPGMLETLHRERRMALDRRPALNRLTPLERDVELMVREALARPADRIEIAGEEPSVSRAWARGVADRIRAEGARYRGLPPAPLWGTIAARGDMDESPPDERANDGPQIRSSIQLMTGSVGVLDMETSDARAGRSRSGAMERDAESGDPDAHARAKASRDPGPHTLNQAESQHLREPARGTGDASGPGGLGTTAGVHDEDPAERDLPPALHYDEWDSDRGTYVKRAAAVRVYDVVDAENTDDDSADQILCDHAALVRQIRHQFERLRARRVLLGRQRSGDDLDVAACVDALVDRRTGASPDDRLYLASRPARRELAIALLADTSGSTMTTVSGSTCVIDVERIALLLAVEALDALGDLYAVYSFAGKSANNVKLTTLKRFDQRNGRTVRRRVSAITPGGFTRLGAAVRHAARALTEQSAGHRLLLILSDGRPNDIDSYQGTYGVEDSRQAILEARASGVFPFCITVDAEASEYLPRIFGAGGHVIVRHPTQLPSALLSVVSALIRRG